MAVVEGDLKIMVHQEAAGGTLGVVAAHTKTKQEGEGALTVVARIVQA